MATIFGMTYFGDPETFLHAQRSPVAETVKDVCKKKYIELFLKKGREHLNEDSLRRALLPEIFTDAVRRLLSPSEYDLVLRICLGSAGGIKMLKWPSPSGLCMGNTYGAHPDFIAEAPISKRRCTARGFCCILACASSCSSFHRTALPPTTQGVGPELYSLSNRLFDYKTRLYHSCMSQDIRRLFNWRVLDKLQYHFLANDPRFLVPAITRATHDVRLVASLAERTDDGTENLHAYMTIARIINPRTHFISGEDALTRSVRRTGSYLLPFTLLQLVRDKQFGFFPVQPGNISFDEFVKSIDDMKADRAVSPPPPIITKVAKTLIGKPPPKKKVLNSQMKEMKFKHRREPLGPTDAYQRPLTQNMEYGWDTMVYPGESAIPLHERRSHHPKGQTDVTVGGEGLTLETYYGVEYIRI